LQPLLFKQFNRPLILNALSQKLLFMDKFIVSVIIPVYNAEKFLRNAIESAVQLEEVGEVILVEDASPDNALMIC